ncbi:hypothetical protein SAMN04488128_106422 [Chitinophaga eiseniae]|uniref:Uncharacterized protein n=1 Tax=Chitinophaga eiseniae TaxID=634771 RepID=A0A1T4TVP0_9BACT|nr:hypothetical protein SAMN04488128_106422 [Chitinophaga eiseniae]
MEFRKNSKKMLLSTTEIDSFIYSSSKYIDIYLRSSSPYRIPFFCYIRIFIEDFYEKKGGDSNRI